MMTHMTEGLTMTVLCRRGDLLNYGPTRVLVVGVFASHDQSVAEPLPASLRVVNADPEMHRIALDVRDLSEHSEHRQVVGVPVVPGGAGHERLPVATMAGGNYLVPEDSRLADFLRDLSGYAYDPAVPFHDRLEG